MLNYICKWICTSQIRQIPHWTCCMTCSCPRKPWTTLKQFFAHGLVDLVSLHLISWEPLAQDTFWFKWLNVSVFLICIAHWFRELHKQKTAIPASLKSALPSQSWSYSDITALSQKCHLFSVILEMLKRGRLYKIDHKIYLGHGYIVSWV